MFSSAGRVAGPMFRGRLRGKGCPRALIQNCPTRFMGSFNCFNRRQRVDALGYHGGKSRHGAPVRKTHRIASSTSRFWPWAFFLFALYGENKLMHAWPIRHPTGLSSYSIRKQILDNHQANNSIILNKSELFKRLTADFVGAPPLLTDDRGLCYEQGVRTLRTKPGLTARVMRSR